MGDDLQDLSDRIAGRGLIGAELAAFDYSEYSTPLVGYSVSGSGTEFRVAENSSSPQFFLYAHPVTGSFPVFEVIENDNTRYLTWTPYANGIVKPYDGTMAGLRLLGFAMPTEGSTGTYAALAGFLPPENYLPDGETLYVRTATPMEAWRVKYFGLTADAGDAANTANPDGDTALNLWEYGCGGDPTNPVSIGYVPVGGLTADHGTSFFQYIYPRRIGSASEVNYYLETATDLVLGDWSVGGYEELVPPGTLDPEFEAVTNRIATAAETNLYIRLAISARPEWSFEDGFEGWINIGGDDFDWSRNTGGTPSSGTGPDRAADGAYYTYTEASGNYPDKVCILSNRLDVVSYSSPQMTFDYHMYGDAGMGSLHLDVFDGSVWHLDVWAVAGAQHAAETDPWTTVTVDLAPYVSGGIIDLQFRGITGNGFRSDMALDHIRIGDLGEQP
jgi:hypothetical protein